MSHIYYLLHNLSQLSQWVIHTLALGDNCFIFSTMFQGVTAQVGALEQTYSVSL